MSLEEAEESGVARDSLWVAEDKSGRMLLKMKTEYRLDKVGCVEREMSDDEIARAQKKAAQTDKQ